MVFCAVNASFKKAKRELANFKREKENARRHVYGEPPVDTFADKKRRFLGRFFPPLLGEDRNPPINFYQSLFYTGTKPNMVVRFCTIWVLCQMIGLIFVTLFTLKYPYAPVFTASVAAIVTQSVIVLIFTVKPLRIVIMLAFPSLLTSKMRSLLLILIVGWAFQSSAQNITANIEQTSESLTCVQQTMGELVQELHEIGPKQVAMAVANAELERMLNSIRNPVNNVMKVLKTFENFIQKGINLKKQFVKVQKFIAKTCRKTLRSPYYTCIAMFDKIYAKCKKHTSWGCGFIYEIKDLMCLTPGFLGTMCNFPFMVRDQIKDKTAMLQTLLIKKAIELLKKNAFFRLVFNAYDEVQNMRNISVAIKTGAEVHETSTLNKTAMAREVKNELRVYANIIANIVWITDVMVVIVLVAPFIMACRYLYNFLTREDWNNIFFSHEFEKIDKQREAQGEATLLPATPAEKETLISTFTLGMVPVERFKVTVSLSLSIIGAIIPLLLILIDMGTYRLAYEAFEFFNNKKTRLETPSMYTLQVTGNGFLSRLYQNILKIVEPVGKKMGHRDESWRECFVEPSPPNYVLFRMMLLMFVVALFLCYATVYAARMRHVIAEYYFPERKRPRALFLYNKVLQNRKTVLAACMKLAKMKGTAEQLVADEAGGGGRADIVNHSLPKVSNDYYNCLRCARADLKLGDSSNARICCNCSYLYCVDCYSVTSRCQMCNFMLQIVSSGTELYVDSSCDELDSELEQLLQLPQNVTPPPGPGQSASDLTSSSNNNGQKEQPESSPVDSSPAKASGKAT